MQRVFTNFTEIIGAGKKTGYHHAKNESLSSKFLLPQGGIWVLESLAHPLQNVKISQWRGRK